MPYSVSMDVSLPQICVLGSQSVGKSSLIESISGVALPRASGTCTRCPTECILIRSSDPREPWQCEVSLRFQVDSRGHPLPLVRNIPFGPLITNPADVEDRIRRAQIAVLNPDLDSVDFPTSFLHGDIPETRTVSFSPNCISLKVRGPDIVDLSFVDLPGIIATIGRNGQQSDMDNVKNLADRYIANPQSIVLLAVTCETDFENQGAWEIAKAHDPDHTRTIGVLTKPDRIEKGNQAKWLDLLKNQKELLQEGWFCVKLPGPEDLQRRIGRSEARQLERDFFQREPWASLQDMRLRLSVESLIERLSEILSDVIAKTLPGLQEEITSLIEQTQEELSALPPEPVENPVDELLSAIGKFQRDIETEIKGTTSGDGLIQKYKRHLEEFRIELRGTAPRFVPFEKGSPNARKVPLMDFLPEEERDLDSHGTVPIIYLDEVHKRAQAAISRELPGNEPFEVKRSLIGGFISQWGTPSSRLFRKMESTLEMHFAVLVNQHFSLYRPLHQSVNIVLNDRRSECRQTASDKLDWILETEKVSTFTLNTHSLREYKSSFISKYTTMRHEKRGYAKAIRILTHPDQPDVTEAADSDSDDDQERGEPGPSRTPAYHQRGQPLNMSYSRALPFHKSGAKSPETEQRHNLLSQIRSSGLPDKVEDVLRILPDDPARDAILVMADVRAYWQVAFKRFLDNIALAIDMDYIRGFSKGLETKLLRQLGVLGPDAETRCRAYYAQPQHIVDKRNTLKAKLRRLEDAQSEIMSLGMQCII
ncbi:P-loop containing nucleoside triphosphate hydrolase protein [Cantharellus anzutake]|uniref:P-loop containing nucleoside triphosphate hydrolase protein n=1 Tax=Cantharellus anzutake TaxID=1750568 RepID=UPI0019059231|nr:P-loop containing nucleoside triphosphate hydrolase protein [Cantharellus anzutake]KAF8323493.1 P-loop containing nucleoside triphosphate hydrolase protein [Cantharellus anzutake]